LNFLLDNWILFLAALNSVGLLLRATLAKSSQVAVLSTAEAVRVLKSEKGVLIDLSEPDEFAAGHVSGAGSIPLSALEEHKSLPGNKSLPLVIVCRNGARIGNALSVCQSPRARLLTPH